MEVGAAVTAIRAAIEAARSARDVHNQAQLDAAVSEIMRELTAAQSDLLSMIVQQQDLVEENRRLKEELAKEARFEQYRLERTPMGGYIMPLKDEHVTDDREAHAICVVCRENGKATPLTEHKLLYRCPVCKAEAWKEPKPPMKVKRARTIRSKDPWLSS